MSTLRLPDALPGQPHATVRQWLVKPESVVAAGQPLVELELEEAGLVIESPAAGRLASINAAAGTTVAAGALLATLADNEPSQATSTPSTSMEGPAVTTPPAPSTAQPQVRPILMPEAGNSMEEGTIVAWRVRPGDRIEAGQVICEIETDKATIEYEAPEGGRLARIVVGAGESIAVKQPIAYLAEDEAAVEAMLNDPTGRPDGRPTEAGAPAATATPSQSSPDAAVVPILMPEAGNTMEEGAVVAWRVKPGDRISVGQVICEIETDKATMEYESPLAGRLARILVEAGQATAVKQPIALLAESDDAVEAYLNRSGAAPASTPPPPAAPTRTQATAAPSTAAPATGSDGRIKASPAARRLAAERQLDLASIGQGSGPGGRILSTDLKRARSAAVSEAPAGESIRRPMSKMRRAIAANLQKSKQTIPHFYVRMTIDADPLFAFYRQQKPTTGCTINDLVVAAVARAMTGFPAMRSRIEGDELIEFAHANVGIAVGVPDGLVVPVVMGVDQLSLAQLAAATRQTVENARKGRIDHMGRGNITISNLGMFGVEEFAAIINPPEAAILAVSALRESVIVRDGAIRAGRVMTLTLSVDHRVVDGLLAAQYLAALKELLEAPHPLAA